MTENYTITLDDVQAYLDSKRDNEIVGVTCSGGTCLVAEAIRAKYPEIDDLIVGPVFVEILEPRYKRRWLGVTIGTGIDDVIVEFDALVGGNEEQPVTKRQWLAKAVQS